MSSKLKQIKVPIAEEMKEFEKKFRSSMKSNVLLLDQITGYIVKRKGKQMRPMFVFLSSKLVGEVNQTTYDGAALIELLHTATLVHDDVVDDANYRRGFFSINALWKNKIAVLVGDYLLSRGLLLSIENNQFHLLKIVSNAVREMSEGELLQIEKARKLNITEDIYYNIIRQKTASLIASCCAVGVASTGADEKEIEKARLLGEKVGMAFQIKDDLFDYGTDDIGKPLGIDIKERKMTLPLIYCLNNCDKKTRSRLINTVKNNNNDPKKVREVIEEVRRSGGIEYTQGKMKEYYNEAMDILNTYPESEARASLQTLISYTIEREH